MISQLTTEALKTLGALINVARRNCGMSQASLAERLGVSRQTVMAVEKGDANVTVGTVFEAAYLLNVPLFSKEHDQLSKWQSALAGFSALLPEKIHRKKISHDF